MDLVRHFASEEGKDGGQFFTPPRIVNLCVRLVDEFEDGHTFHDPTVGSDWLVFGGRFENWLSNSDGDLMFARAGLELEGWTGAIAGNTAFDVRVSQLFVCLQ
jgi:type I restriction enzyme M protein